jgi:hypothetical protein
MTLEMPRKIGEPDNYQSGTNEKSQDRRKGAAYASKPMTDQRGKINYVRPGHDPRQREGSGELLQREPAAILRKLLLNASGHAAAEARQANF